MISRYPSPAAGFRGGTGRAVAPARSLLSRQAAARMRESSSNTDRLPDTASPNAAKAWAIAAMTTSVAASATIISTSVMPRRLIR